MEKQKTFEFHFDFLFLFHGRHLIVKLNLIKAAFITMSYHKFV